MCKSSKHDNKGFTLVEMIIIVAIMAVLAATIAMNVIHYIEKGRESKDLYHASLIKDALNVYPFPSNFPGSPVTDTDIYGVSRTYTRGWVYVDRDEIRCSHPSCALALIDAGLVFVSPETEEELREAEENNVNVWTNNYSGDYVGVTDHNEGKFECDLHSYARRRWNTYQLDVFIYDDGTLHLGANASNLSGRADNDNTTAIDEETSDYFANALGFTNSIRIGLGPEDRNMAGGNN